MPRLLQHTQLVALIAVSICAGTAAAAPFTPGNIIVATAPGVSPNPAPITIAEYAPAFGAPVQTYTIPHTGSPPIGSTEYSAVNAMQIAFNDADNQHLYVATTWTNLSITNPRRPGFVRVAAGPTIHVDAAFENGVADQLCRGVAATAGYVFTSTGDGSARNADAAFESYFGGNALWLEVFNGELFVSSSASGPPFTPGTGIYKMSPTGPAPAALSLVLGATDARPLGFAFADANTVYVAMYLDGGSYPAGLHKWTFTAGAWTYQGRLTGIPGAVYDVAAVVSGASVTVYALTATAVWRVDDTLASSGPGWTGAAAASVLTGLSRGRSLAVVPPSAVPSCSCSGDLVTDQQVNGRDIAAFAACLLTGSGSCACGDFNNSTTVTAADIAPFVTRLLTFTTCNP